MSLTVQRHDAVIMAGRLGTCQNQRNNVRRGGLGGGVGGVERICEGIPEAGKQVAVAVEGHRDVLVPEAVLDRLGVRPGADQQRRARVPEVMEADAVLVGGQSRRDSVPRCGRSAV